MSDTVIKVDSLSKAYKIGLKERQGRTFREAVLDTAAAPFRRLASLATGGNGHGGAQETFWALKDVSFEVKRGEVVGIIGRNGAGKSTLLKILSQITEPTSGEVRMRGRVASLLEVGTGFHPELTGRENIYLNGAILGMKRAEITRKFDEIVAFAEVEKFLDTPVKHYSSGMYVRLAFAVAAHLEPEILIVDEVLAVGDAEFQKKCLGKMQEVSKGEGRTVLFVSHNMAAVAALCAQCVLLQHGERVFRGGAREGIQQYLHARVCHGPIGEPIVGDGFDLIGVRVNKGNGAGAVTYAPCAIEVSFRSHITCSVAVYFAIESANGQLVAGIDSLDLVPNCRARAGQEVKCKLDVLSLPLIPGTYRLQLMFRNDSDFHTWLVPTTFEFHVDGRSVYGQRQVDSRWHGTTAVRATVEFNEPSLAPFGASD